LSSGQSELNIEEKASDSASSKKREHKEEGDGTITENTEGKDVKKQKTEKESVKTDKRNTKAKGEEKNAAPGHEEQKKKGGQGGGTEKENTRQIQGN
jgi:hypothetical protein